MRIIAATQNKGKIKELKLLAEEFGFELVSQADIGLADLDVEETGTTFQENSFLKADAVCKLTGEPCIADDSGLMIDYLDGAPGVFSARFGGEHGNDAKNREKVLSLMKDVPAEKRGAHFVCCITLLYPDGTKHVAIGECHGHIDTKESGELGFGYDKIFIPDGYEESFATLGSDVKNVIGHRAKALGQLRELLSR